MALDFNLCAGDGRAVFQLAACGDLAAQRCLAQAALAVRDEASRLGGAVDAATAEAIFWTRLAAAHGDASDGMRLSEALAHGGNVMFAQGRGDAAVALSAESVAILRVLAGAGHAEAAHTVHIVMGDLSPAVIRRSTEIMEAAAHGPTEAHH